ncbi:unnamed protein product [Caretta caretta]
MGAVAPGSGVAEPRPAPPRLRLRADRGRPQLPRDPLGPGPKPGVLQPGRCSWVALLESPGTGQEKPPDTHRPAVASVEFEPQSLC